MSAANAFAASAAAAADVVATSRQDLPIFSTQATQFAASSSASAAATAVYVGCFVRYYDLLIARNFLTSQSVNIMV